MHTSIGRKANKVIVVLSALFAHGAMAAPAPNDPVQGCKALVSRLYDDAWPKGATRDDGAHAKFEGHYNARLGTCFLLETVSQVMDSPALREIRPRLTQRLSDPILKKDYARYDSWSDMPPMTCWVLDTKCSSNKEWLHLIEPYFNE